jgi:acyl-CoA synthetase (AMP-forming)/AMP-acid ligase II
LQSLERFLHKFDKPGRRYRTLAFLLFDHVAGIDTLFYTLASGGTLVTTRDRTPDAICELIESARVEVLPASPSFLRLMCLRAGASDRDLGTLKIITYGSEPMDPSTLARLGSQFPNAEIIQKYGTTETGSPRSKSRGRDSLWLRIKSAELETRVVDEVLHIRSEGMILGYLNAPSPIDGDGWYCTGDLVDVETDSEGEWIRFRGRASDAINVGGEKVSPAEVEQTILELPFVKDVVVRGEPHAMLGQIVTARVTLLGDTDEKTATKQIRKRCRARLAPYKVPVKIAIVADGLTSDRQKALRRTP